MKIHTTIHYTLCFFLCALQGVRAANKKAIKIEEVEKHKETWEKDLVEVSTENFAKIDNWQTFLSDFEKSINNKYSLGDIIRPIYRLRIFEGEHVDTTWIANNQKKAFTWFIRLRVNLNDIKRHYTLNKKTKEQAFFDSYLILNSNEVYASYDLWTKVENSVDGYAIGPADQNMIDKRKAAAPTQKKNVYFRLLHEFYTIFEGARLENVSLKLYNSLGENLTTWLDLIHSTYQNYYLKNLKEKGESIAGLLEDKYIHYKDNSDTLLQWMKTTLSTKHDNGLCFELFEQLLLKIVEKKILQKNNDLIKNVITPLKQHIYGQQIKASKTPYYPDMLLSVDTSRRSILDIKQDTEYAFEKILMNFIQERQRYNTTPINILKRRLQDSQNKKTILNLLTSRFQQNYDDQAKKVNKGYLSQLLQIKLDKDNELWQSLSDKENITTIEPLIKIVGGNLENKFNQFKQKQQKEDTPQPPTPNLQPTPNPKPIPPKTDIPNPVKNPTQDKKQGKSTPQGDHRNNGLSPWWAALPITLAVGGVFAYVLHKKAKAKNRPLRTRKAR